MARCRMSDTEERKYKAAGICAGLGVLLVLVISLFGHEMSGAEMMLTVVMCGVLGAIFCP